MYFKRENHYLLEAGKLLTSIKEDPDRLDLVLTLHRYLIRKIIICEQRIGRLKKARIRMSRLKKSGFLSKSRSKTLKLLIQNLDRRILYIQDLMYIWRCFGDGIAAIYQSKYALKHLFYDESYHVKQEAGNLSGKQGFRLEYKVLISALKHNIPAVLSDITNVIRHGDICALGASDPFPIELKSSSNLSKRAKRQIEQISAIHEFFIKDGLESFRGQSNVKRVALINPEINYEQHLNECMDIAMRDNASLVVPEAGLAYLAYRPDMPESDRPAVHRLLEKYYLPSTHFIALSPGTSWLPLYPYTLSMTPTNSTAFIQGQIEVAVLINLEVLKGLFTEKGVHAIAVMDGTHSLQIALDPKDLGKGVFRLSEQIYLRIAYEFQSLRWFAEEHSSFIHSTHIFDDSKPISTLVEGKKYPPEWETVTDCYLDS